MNPHHRLRPSLIMALATTVILSCNPKPKSTTEMSRNKTPYENPNPFVNGPALNQGEKAHSWAEARQLKPDKSKRHFRMPVFVDRDPKNNFLNPKRYYAGVESGADNKDILEIRLDDVRLGISLNDRIAQYCPEEDQSCIIQIEATWGPQIEFVSAMHDDRPVLALVNVLEFTGDPSAGNAAFFISAEK